MKNLLLLVICFNITLSAYAGRPKTGPGFAPGLGDGNTTGSGSGNTNSEVTLPVGLPSTGGDPSLAPSVEPASTSNIVYTFDLSDDNGAASVNQTHSALEKARTLNASCVLIRINGFAGGWDVAENIRQEILGYDKPVMVFVNNQAVPAASFISSGADSVYTKQGSTISNRNAKGKLASKSEVNKEQLAMNESAAMSAAQQSAHTEGQTEYSSDVTMKEILYKAGLSNLTVVKHDAGFSEQCIGILSKPMVVMLILIIAGFILRRTRTARMPGPMLYALALMMIVVLAPFQLAGLASAGEIAGTVAVTALLILSSRRDVRWLSVTFLFVLALMITTIHLGDISALLIYDSKNTLIAEALITLACLFAGWWIGSLQRKTISTQEIGKSNRDEVLAFSA